MTVHETARSQTSGSRTWSRGTTSTAGGSEAGGSDPEPDSDIRAATVSLSPRECAPRALLPFCMARSVVFTVGYEGRTPDELIELLARKGVRRVVHVRALPLSRRRGFSKTPLREALGAHGIDYVHLRDAGNPYRDLRADPKRCLRLYAGTSTRIPRCSMPSKPQRANGARRCSVSKRVPRLPQVRDCDPACARVALFGETPVNTRTVALEPGAELVLVRGFLAEPERAALLAESASYPWEHQPVMGMPTLRANAWFAEDARAVYEYTGQRWVPAPLTLLQSALRDRLEPMLGERMNAVLAAYYPHGGAGVGYHADNEAILGNDPTIASLSIGAMRTFQIAHVSRGRPPVADLEIPLDDGDLLVMRGTFQRRYRQRSRRPRAAWSPPEPFLPERSARRSGLTTSVSTGRPRADAARAAGEACAWYAFRADARARATPRGAFRFRRATAGLRRR